MAAPAPAPAPATATATAATYSSSSSSASLPLWNKLLHLPSDYNSLSSISPPYFPSKTIPIKALKLKAQYPYYLPFALLSTSVLFRASAVFDNVDVVSEDEQSTELPETETETEREEEGGDDDDEKTETESAEAGRLYVENLPYDVTSSQLDEVFREAGRVVSVEIVYDRVKDRSRGFSFVTMGSFEEAKEAIRMFDGSDGVGCIFDSPILVLSVGGRTVKVNFPEVPRGGEREVMGSKIRSSNQGSIDSPHKIYAGNLSWSLTSQGLREVFAAQPGVLSAKVIYDKDTRRSRGFGFVTFASAEELESALSAMNGVDVEGRPL